MRFAELSLERYGQFENRRLRFPSAPIDFHVVFGQNEAGKSTTLAAVSDLLFGFPQRATYDFRFDAKLLRLGAVIENGAGQLTCRRRRGKQGTLVDARDQAIDEGPLLAMLSGEARDGFRAACSLDHVRMREGGRAIVEAKDDVGQALFAAGSGMIGIARILDGLDEEADGIWGKRAAEKRAYTRAERDYENARRALRELQLKPSDWKAARDDLERFEADWADLQKQLGNVGSDLSRVERLRRVLEPIRRRAAVLQRLAEAPAAALSPIVEKSAEDALGSAADAQRRQASSSELRRQACERLEGVSVDEKMLAAAGTVDTLLEQRGSIAKGLADLPRREAELALQTAQLEDLAKEIGLAKEADGSFRLPSRIPIAALRKLAADRAANEIELKEIESQRLGHVQRLQELETEQVEPADAELLERLEKAVLGARPVGDLEQQVIRKQHAFGRLREEEQAAFSRLGPWSGEAGALRRLTVPSDAVVDSARDLIGQASNSIKDEQKRLDDITEELEELGRSTSNLSRGGQAVPVESLTGARSARDRSWTQVRDHLTGDRSVAEPAREADSFEALMKGADTLADLRFVSSEASGRLSQLHEQANALRLDAEQTARRRNEATAQYTRCSTEWTNRLKASGLPELSPMDFREWRDLRNDALAAATAAQESADEVEVDLTRLTDIRSQLRAALREDENDGEAFADLLGRAENLRAALVERQASLNALKRQIREERARLAEVTLRKEGLVRAAGDLRDAWDQSVQQIGFSLGMSDAEAKLALCEDMRVVLGAVTELKHRIETIAEDAQKFERQVISVATGLGHACANRKAAEIVDQLRERKAEAQRAEQTRAGLADEVKRHEEAARTATADLEAADESLNEVRRLAQAGSHSEIAAAIDASRARRKMDEEVADIEREVARVGDGVAQSDLVSACSTEDADSLARRAGELRAQQIDLTARTAGAAGRCAEARAKFDSLDSGDKAAIAAADLAAARAEMTALADEYVLKRTQALILRWAIEKYRERRQNPILTRAAELFRTLTLGGFVELRVSTDASTPRLFGIRADRKTVVEVEGMSEGTQDQLFFALRVAALEQRMQVGSRFPFLADDLFVNFDGPRARAGLEILRELAKTTQVLFFTHHEHLVDIARDVFGGDTVSVVSLEAND